jgi:hypothetical protein
MQFSKLLFLSDVVRPTAKFSRKSTSKESESRIFHEENFNPMSVTSVNIKLDIKRKGTTPGTCL